jgi:hypothetical protein
LNRICSWLRASIPADLQTTKKSTGLMVDFFV